MKKEEYQLDIFGNFKKVSMVAKEKKCDKKFFDKKENYGITQAKYKAN